MKGYIPYQNGIQSTIDYYPFGMEMPGRVSNASAYRFGMNGQMKDNEFTGQDGAHTTAMFWEYDSRIGRRWNRDPKPDASTSIYACFGDNPVIYNDVNGDKWDPTLLKNGKDGKPIHFSDTDLRDSYTETYFSLVKSSDIFKAVHIRLTTSNTTYTVWQYDGETSMVNSDGSTTYGKYYDNTASEPLRKNSINLFYGADNETVFEECYHAFQDDFYSETGEKRKRGSFDNEIEVEFASAMAGEDEYGLLKSCPNIIADIKAGNDISNKSLQTDKEGLIGFISKKQKTYGSSEAYVIDAKKMNKICSSIINIEKSGKDKK